MIGHGLLREASTSSSAAGYNDGNATTTGKYNPTSDCTGTQYEQGCWHLGEAGLCCYEVCSSRSGYDPYTEDY